MNITFAVPCFVTGDQVIARLSPPTIRQACGAPDDLPVTLTLVGIVSDAAGGTTAGYAGPGWTVEDHVERVGDGEYRCKRTWCNESAHGVEVVLSCSVEHAGRNLSYLIPAVSYNGNGWGKGREPKGLYDEENGEQALWVFGGDRCSVPACTISEGEDFALGLYGEPDDATQSGCALETA